MAGNLSHSMRDNYNTHGVGAYYTQVAETYRNPHYPGLRKVLHEFMDRFVERESPKSLHLLDLAAGSGEATEILLQWRQSRCQTVPAIYQNEQGDSVPIPSPAPTVGLLPPRSIPPILDSNSVTTKAEALKARIAAKPAPNRPRISEFPTTPPPAILSITAADPYTAAGYKLRTNLPCLELSFNDVAHGKLPNPPQQSTESGDSNCVYDVVVISFALHLVESNSELWALLSELSKRAKWLVVTAPHKKPEIKPNWGFTRWGPSRTNWGPATGRGNVGGTEGDGFEIVLDRVRLRVWRSEQHFN